MFGSLIFLCSDKEAENITDVIQSDSTFLEDHVSELIGPFKFRLEEPGVLYRVRFTGDQWLDVVAMGSILEANNIEADIVHAVSENNYVDVVSTSGYYDQFTDDRSEIAAIFDTYGFDLDADIDNGY